MGGREEEREEGRGKEGTRREESLATALSMRRSTDTSRI